MSNLDRFERRVQSLPKRPRLHPGYELIEVGPGHHLLHSGLRSFEIKQPFPGLSLARFLDQLSHHQTLTTLLEPLPPFQIAFFLDVLETLSQAGLLVPDRDGEGNGTSGRYAYHSLLFDHIRRAPFPETMEGSLDVIEWQERLASARVGLVGLGRVGSQLARLLAITGVGHLTGADEGTVEESLLYADAWYEAEDRGVKRTAALARRLERLNPELRFAPLSTPLGGDKALPAELLDHDLLVVTTDQPRPALYEWINSKCIEVGIPWTSYRVSWTEFVVEIGPTVYPKETACYTCYQSRRRSNLVDPEQDKALAQALNTRSLPLLDLQITPGVPLLCYEILRFLSGQMLPLTFNAILDFNILKGEMNRRPLLKIPRCPACRRDVKEFAPTRFWADLRAEMSLSPTEE